MRKYSAEELKNLNREDLISIGQEIAEGKFDFNQYTLEENKIITEKIHEENMHYLVRGCVEFIRPFNREMASDQVHALAIAYLSFNEKKWSLCRFGLEAFFEYESLGDINQVDLSDLDYELILDWYVMLSETELCDEPKGTPIRLFYEKVLDQFISRMPEHGNSKMMEGFKMFFPEARAALEKSDICTLDGQKCLTISEAAELFGISEEEVLNSLSSAETEELLVPSEQTYSLQ